MKKTWKILAALSAVVLALGACVDSPVKPPEGDAVQPSEKLYPVWKLGPQGKEWGYINESGKQVIATRFESAEFFSDYGSGIVGQDGKKALISAKGEFLLKPVYESLAIHSGDRRIGVRDGSWTELLDRHGNAVYDTELNIHPMPEGGARIEEYMGDRLLMGYIDDTGAVTIEPQFPYASDFHEQRAVVQTAESDFALIDPTGKRVAEFEAAAAGNPSEGMFPYLQSAKTNPLWGYRDMAGKVVIKPLFAEAGPFRDGLAIVGQRQKNVLRYGLISDDGKYVLRPNYERIEDLGNGFYAVSRDAGPDFGQRTYPMAIFNGAGKRLTDYLYYEAALCTADTISVSDGNETWVLDSSGKAMSTMPRLSGMGMIRQEGNLLVGEADDERAYFTLSGELVWQSPWETVLKDAVKLNRQKFRPDRGKVIYYPALAGLADGGVQERINNLLAYRFIGDGSPSVMAETVPTVTLRADYTAHLNKDLLVVEKFETVVGSEDGQAHQSRQRLHIDLRDGAELGLQDLFRSDSAWSQLLAEQIKGRLGAVAAKTAQPLDPNLVMPVLSDRPFLAGRYGLVLYYEASELGGEGTAVISIEIPYSAILKDISTEGRFWNAFLKQDM